MKVFKKAAVLVLSGFALLSANVAHAQAATQTLGSLIKVAMSLLNVVVPIIITVIVIFIAWAGISFARDEEGPAKSKHRVQMVNGIIALAIIFSIFGIIRVLQNTVFGGSQQNDPTGQNLETPAVFNIQ